jgi:hypothetical protein
MAANHEGSAVPAGNPTTSFTVAFPFATDTNHKCFLAVVSRGHTSGDAWPSVTDNEPSGNAWVRLAGTTDRKASFWYRVATVDTWQYTVTVSGCIGSSAGALHIFSGANGYRVWGFETNASGDESHAGYTPLQNNSYVNLSVFDYGGANAATGFSAASGTGAWTTWQTKQSTGGSGCSVASAGGFQTGGPSAVGTMSWSQTNSTTYSLLWELTEDKHYEVNPADSGSFTITGTDATLTYGAGAGGYTVTADSGSFSITGTAASPLMGRKVVADSGSFAVTGTDAGTLLGRKATADSGAFAITGTDAGALVGRLVAADSGSFSITGTDAGALVGRRLAADSGAVAITGTDASVSKGYGLVADPGSFSISGTDAGALLGRGLTADSGSFAITGTDATLTYGTGRTMLAESGAFSISGTDAAALIGRRLTADPGSFSVTGTDAGTHKGRTLTADSGSFAITGTDAGARAARLLTAESGSVSITGTAAGVLRGYPLTADPGSFSISGTAASTLLGRKLVADSGAFVVTGTAAALTRTGGATPSYTVTIAVPVDARTVEVAEENRTAEAVDYRTAHT